MCSLVFHFSCVAVCSCVVCSRGVDELETNGDNEKGASAIATTREVAEAGKICLTLCLFVVNSIIMRRCTI